MAEIAVVVLVSSSRSPTFPTPASAAAVATRDYLSGAGAPLLALDQLSGPLWHADTPELRTVCETVVTALAQHFGNTASANLAAQVPDPVLAQLFLGEQAAIVNGLSLCGTNDLTAARAQFSLAGKSSNLVHRRMTELHL